MNASEMIQVGFVVIGCLAFLVIIAANVIAQRSGPNCAWCRDEEGYPPLPRGISSTICQRHHDAMLAEAETISPGAEQQRAGSTSPQRLIGAADVPPQASPGLDTAPAALVSREGAK